MNNVIQKTRHRFAWVAALALILFACVALYASHFSGRSLWCDEILNLWFQKLSIADLLKCEHNRQSSSQTTLSYLVQRPLAILLGLELGGFAASMIAGLLLVWTVANTARRAGGERVGYLALLLAATSPMILYFSSEWAFYIFWGAASAVSLSLSARWVRQPEAFPFRSRVWLTLASMGMAGFHFAGLFVWLGMVFVVSILLMSAVKSGSRWRVLFRYLATMCLPMLLLVPMFAQAQKVQFLMGTKTIDSARILPALSGAVDFPVRHLLSLTGGGYTYVGLLLLLLGAVALWRSRGQGRRLMFLALPLLAAIVPFIWYVSLRQHFLNVSRYYIYAVAPVLLVIAFGADWLFSSKNRAVRCAGYLLFAVLMVSNVMTGLAILGMRGRHNPFGDITASLAKLPRNRTVVCPNQYELRFLGNYYPIPNGGVAIAPSQWEEGAEARASGLRRIWELVPDAVLYLPQKTYDQEVEKSGIGVPVRYSFPYGKLLELSWRMRTYPERGYYGSDVTTLSYRTVEDLEQLSQNRSSPLSVPGGGFKTVCFRDARGVMQFGLLEPTGAAPLSINVFMPEPTQADRAWTLDLMLASYGQTRLKVAINGKPVSELTASVPRTVAKSLYLPGRQNFDGLPQPEHLLNAGGQFAVQMQPALLRIPLAGLPTGWSTVTLTAAQKTPWLLLGHACKPSDLASPQ